MKGSGYLKRLYAKMRDGIVVARDAVVNEYSTLAELVSPVPQHSLLYRHDQGLNMVIVDGSMNPIEERYREPGSDLTTILERLTPSTIDSMGDEQPQGQVTQWTRKEVVTRRTLPNGRVAVALAYLAPDLQEEIEYNPRFMLHEHP